MFNLTPQLGKHLAISIAKGDMVQIVVVTGRQQVLLEHNLDISKYMTPSTVICLSALRYRMLLLCVVLEQRYVHIYRKVYLLQRMS